MFFFGGRQQQALPPFQQQLRCHSMAFLERAGLECTGKIVLPPSALDHLTRLHIDYPMLFCVRNPKTDAQTHCGVLEFVAEEGMCYLPYWMMQRIQIQEGEFLTITSATLQKGEFVKLRPHTTSFIDISNPRAVLEMAFRGYSTLTVGDTIYVEYNSKTYMIDVLEIKPPNLKDAITIIEADLQVDFAPPLDYVEPPRVFQPAPVIEGDNANPMAEEEGEGEEEGNGREFLSFSGKYHTISGKAPKIMPPSKKKPVAVKPQAPVKKKEDLEFKTRELVKKEKQKTTKRRRKRGEDISAVEEQEEPLNRGPLSFSGKAYSLKD